MTRRTVATSKTPFKPSLEEGVVIKLQICDSSGLLLYFMKIMSFQGFYSLGFHLSRRTYKDIEELKKDFTEGALHPADLKPALSTGLNKILQVRKSDLYHSFSHFSLNFCIIVLKRITSSQCYWSYLHTRYIAK